MAYGRYLSELFGVSGVRHIRGTVTAIRPDPSGAVVELASGEKLRAAQTVLALGHFPPVDVPEVGAGVVEAGAYRRDPWGGAGPLPAPDLRPDLAVALIGTGLTSIDMLLSLRGSGHRGEITMISRHGLLSRGHAPFEPLSAPVLPLTTQPETLAYFKTFRKALREGCDWRAATDSLRSVSCALWEKLSFREKYLFRRHLFHYWSVSRHRMAPGIAATIRMELADGRLKVRRGYVQSVMRGRDGAVLTLRTGGGTACADFGRVINCTGPDTQYRRVVSPLLSGLFDNGLAREGDLGVALALDSDGRVMDASGVPHPSLYAIGPMRAGALFETTAIPEIRQQASDLAALVAADYGSDRRFLSA
ncbi:hydroxyacylglutathione hydrolase [Acetobacter oeni LMG 21952]|nr:hydroxyacylglutathione hydrolase [Acetobacter oeni LMG 21952]